MTKSPEVVAIFKDEQFEVLCLDNRKFQIHCLICEARSSMSDDIAKCFENGKFHIEIHEMFDGTGEQF
jgi:hypothetical protein